MIQPSATIYSPLLPRYLRKKEKLLLLVLCIHESFRTEQYQGFLTVDSKYYDQINLLYT